MLVVTLSSARLRLTSPKGCVRKALITMTKRRLAADSTENRKLIVGLGNPGNKYNGTRHNIGFNIVDKLAEMYDIPMTKTKFNSVYGSTEQNKSYVNKTEKSHFLTLFCSFSGYHRKPTCSSCQASNIYEPFRIISQALDRLL
jgi:hypothetical protein